MKDLLGRTTKMFFASALCVLSFSAYVQAKTFYFTDTEGRKEAFLQLEKEGKIKFVNGLPKIIDSDAKIVFGGDLPDRGPDSIKLREWIVSLKKSYPDRVTLIWGNRDLNKLALMADLPKLNTLEHSTYREWLSSKLHDQHPSLANGSPEFEKRLKSFNSSENQLSWWFSNQGAPQALGFHQQEMQELSKKPVTLQQAADDYIKSLNPKNGKYIEYLKLGQIGHIDESAIFLHGGATEENIGIIPGQTTKETNAKTWVKKLNDWGKTELDKLLKSASSNATNIKSKLIVYGDATWDESVKRVIAQSQSVIYPDRFKESGNLRLPSDEVIDFYKKSGISMEVLGHTPAGNIPVPLKTDKFVRIMGDTSFGPTGTKASMMIDGGKIHVNAVTANGDLVQYSLNPLENSKVGLMANDYTIVGTSNHKNVIYKYYDGYKLDEQLKSDQELKSFKLQSPKYIENEEFSSHRKMLLEYLDKQNVPLMSKLEVNQVYPKKKPILFSGASKFSFEDGSEEKVRSVFREYIKKLNPNEHFIVTGGTDHGVEKIVHELANERGIDLVGLISEGTVPQELNPHLKSVVVAGQGWDDPLTLGLEVVKNRNGGAVFAGGGGVVNRGIDKANQIGVDFKLFDGVPGASTEWSKKLPSKSFTNIEELVHKGDLKQAKKIAVYTGSFDPPHNSHKNIIKEVMEKYKIDELYVVPDKTSAHKPGMMALEDRKVMSQKMFGDIKGVKFLTPEMEAALGNGEMWDVMKVIHGQHPSDKLNLIMGTDTFKWYEKLSKEKQGTGYNIIVNSRDPSVIIPDQIGDHMVMKVNPVSKEISSTEIRQQLKLGLNPESLNQETIEYIRSKNLYGPKVVESTSRDAINTLRAKNKKVITLIGYSGAEYQDKTKMLEQVREILKAHNPATTIVNIGATPEGIGEAYKVAKEMGFETTGIVSSQAKKYGGAFSSAVDHVYMIEDEGWGGFVNNTSKLSPTSEAMVSASDEIYTIGGGQVGADESRAAMMQKKPVKFIPAEMNHEIAIKNAAKKGLPTPANFKGAAHDILSPEIFSHDEIVNYFKGRNKGVVTLVGYSGAEYQDKKKMLETAERYLKKLDPKKVIINIGGTPEGIGEVYELAKAKGFETAGIVSSQAKKYGGFSPYVDKVMLVDDATWGGYKSGSLTLEPTSRAMVDVTDHMLVIGGGEVGAAEMMTAAREGKKVTFVKADMNHDIAIKKAIKAGKEPPTSFQGMADEAWTTKSTKSVVNNLEKSISEVTASDALKAIKGKQKKVITLIGYSGAEYQDKAKMLDHVREILKTQNPATTIVNIGATPEGIGEAYKVAKEMGFETTGIVSSQAKKYGGAFSSAVDHVYMIEDEGWGGFVNNSSKLSPTSEAMVNASDEIYTIGGGQVGADESRAALMQKKPMKFIPAEMNHEVAIKNASKKGFPTPTQFQGAAHDVLAPEVLSHEEILNYFKSKNKAVVTFVGYSGAEYQDKKKMLDIAEKYLAKLDPKKVIINIGATPEGIGEVYQLAKAKGFETVGIVSSQAKKYGGFSPYADRVLLVDDATWGGFKPGTTELEPTSRAMIDVSDRLMVIGGGEVGAAEMMTAMKEGKKVTFVPADMNHEIAIKKALKAAKEAPTSFSGAAEDAWAHKSISLRPNCDLSGVLKQIFVGKVH